MELQRIQHQLEIKELEIKALLEITQAINNNVAEDALYKIFKFTSLSSLKFNKLCLYVRDQEWSAKVNFGTLNEYSGIIPDAAFTGIRKINKVCELINSGPFTEFDLVVPIAHKGEIISLLFVGRSGEQHESTADERLGFLQALSNIMVVAIENRKLAKKEIEQEAFRKEMEIASDVQQLLFPERLPKSGKVILEASYLPHDRVGGDYYDFIPLTENRFVICIADVSGKGVSAALLMANFQATLRSLVLQNAGLPETIEKLNVRLFEITKGDRFITCFLALFDLDVQRMTYVNAGHIQPIAVDPSGSLQFLEKGTTILGAFPSIKSLQIGEVRLDGPITLFSYTDGLTETLDENGNEFGTQWLADYFKKKPFPDLSTLHQDVIIELDQFKGRNPYQDDITMLSCRINA